MRLTIALCLFALPTAAHAQCAPITEALTALADNYAETPRVTALMAGGNVLIITAAPGGGFTALEVKPGGEACIVAAGEAFELHAPEAPGSDS